MRSFSLVTALLVGAAALSILPGCEKAPPIPASSDPQGKDLVEGAVVAASEQSGGYRVYKVVHVDDFPPPLGWDLHMIAYDPKVQSFEEAAAVHRKKGYKVALDYMLVRLVNFLPRDHRVIAVEPVTDEEMKPYIKARDSRK